ncbi:hypothetical protein C8R44DRAFT_731406 [Mycena epipterygia]|nr:hypothetical protein C8R44DRAFT_731406 [Mycena epipterygia]
MPAKVVILAQFGHGYHIRGTVKRLMGVLAWLKAWWIRFDHGYYIHETLKKLTDFVAWIKAWWISLSVKQVTDQKSVPPLHHRRGNAHKNVLAWLKVWWIRLTDVVAWLKVWWIRMSMKQVTDAQSMPLLPHRRGNSLMILAQFGHRYHIRETLKRLMGVLTWLKALWISLSVKQVTDQKSMPLLPRWRGNARKSHDFGSVWPWISYSWDVEEADGNPCHSCLTGEEMPTKVMILAQFDLGYYIRESLKRLTDVVAWLKVWWIRFDPGYYIRETLKRLTDVVAWLKACGEEMPTKVMILAQFDQGYYIRESLKRLPDLVAWLKVWWIRLSMKQVTDQKPRHRCLAGEEMPAKVMNMAQFDHGYYIRETLKRPTDVVAWLKVWWIRMSMKQVTDAQSMPLLPHRRGNALVILAQFGHGYHIRETLKRLMGVLAWLKAWWISLSVKQVTDQKSMPLLPRWGGKVVILAQFGHRYYIQGTLKWLTGVWLGSGLHGLKVLNTWCRCLEFYTILASKSPALQ